MFFSDFYCFFHVFFSCSPTCFFHCFCVVCLFIFLLFKTSGEKVLMEEILHKLMKDGVFLSIILSSPQSKLKVWHSLMDQQSQMAVVLSYLPSVISPTSVAQGGVLYERHWMLGIFGWWKSTAAVATLGHWTFYEIFFRISKEIQSRSKLWYMVYYLQLHTYIYMHVYIYIHIWATAKTRYE